MAQRNLLQNGGLSGGFSPYRNQENLATAAGWAPWWLPRSDEAPQWANQQPTYAPSELDAGLVQSVATPWGTHDGGLVQQLPSAVGNRYELSVEVQAWSSDDDTPGSRRQAGDVNVRLGFDPTGGLDPASPLIVWSEAAQPIGRWQTLRLTVESQATINTVYLRSAPALPRRQQTVFWRNAFLRGIGRYKRATHIVGSGDTHISLRPEKPPPGSRVLAEVSSNLNHPFIDLLVRRPDDALAAVAFQGVRSEGDRYSWRYEFAVGEAGLYDLRFVSDRGASLLALRLIQIAENVQVVPSNAPRLAYRRVYVLLPPTADEKWAAAAARGGFDRRFTVGFSADDAGVGELGDRFILAVNPHHWPEVLTADWFNHHYPGATFTPVVANAPADLEAWLRAWEPEGHD